MLIIWDLDISLYPVKDLLKNISTIVDQLGIDLTVRIFFLGFLIEP